MNGTNDVEEIEDRFDILSVFSEASLLSGKTVKSWGRTWAVNGVALNDQMPGHGDRTRSEHWYMCGSQFTDEDLFYFDCLLGKREAPTPSGRVPILYCLGSDDVQSFDWLCLSMNLDIDGDSVTWNDFAFEEHSDGDYALTELAGLSFVFEPKHYLEIVGSVGSRYRA